MKEKPRRRLLTVRRVLIGGAAFVLAIVGALWFASWNSSNEARFARSKPALEAFAAQVMASDRTSAIVVPKQIGDFATGPLERLPHGSEPVAD